MLKIASPDIAHKSDIGGVLLNLDGPDAVAAGYDRIMASVRAAKPDAAIDGVLVGPMRAGGGVELFVGVLRDPLWGPAIAVGLGGIWVEALRDTAIRLLPVTPAEVLEMFSELRGAKLLDGYRGTPWHRPPAAAEAVARIGDAALALGPALASLEVNPLLRDGGRGARPSTHWPSGTRRPEIGRRPHPRHHRRRRGHRTPRRCDPGARARRR